MAGNPGHAFIVYDGTTITFPSGAAHFQKRPASLRSLLISHGKVHSVSLRQVYDVGRLIVEKFEDAEIERQLWAWWSWAVRGNVYQVAAPDPDPILAKDGIADTTVNATEPPGSIQIAVPTPDGVDFKPLERYDVSEAAGHEFERVEIKTPLRAALINLKDGTSTKYGYIAGDKIAHRSFFPRAVSLDDAQPWRRNQTTGFTFDHRFREVA